MCVLGGVGQWYLLYNDLNSVEYDQESLFGGLIFGLCDESGYVPLTNEIT